MRPTHGRRPHAARWLIARVLLVLATIAPPASTLLPTAPTVHAATSSLASTSSSQPPLPWPAAGAFVLGDASVDAALHGDSSQTLTWWGAQ
jgi:hypothetical protein